MAAKVWIREWKGLETVSVQRVANRRRSGGGVDGERRQHCHRWEGRLVRPVPVSYPEVCRRNLVCRTLSTSIVACRPLYMLCKDLLGFGSVLVTKPFGI